MGVQRDDLAYKMTTTIDIYVVSYHRVAFVVAWTQQAMLVVCLTSSKFRSPLAETLPLCGLPDRGCRRWTGLPRYFLACKLPQERPLERGKRLSVIKNAAPPNENS